MHIVTIIWTLICAAIIIGYPMYLLNNSYPSIENIRKQSSIMSSNLIELLSYDLSEQSPGWSFAVDVPQITEQVLKDNLVLFYLESDDSCLKLPYTNGTLGYSGNIYKNVGRVYLTFKCLADGVSNFYVPSWHLGKLKIMIIKSRDEFLCGGHEMKNAKSEIYKELQKVGVNINNYEEVLTYFSNMAPIDFKGHFKASKPKPFTPSSQKTRLAGVHTRNYLSPLG